jgi:hypothetical protein
VPPGAHDSARTGHRRRQPPEALLPLVAPDLQVHVDDVVVGDRETGEAVPDRERPRLTARLEAPDDADPSAEVLGAERSRWPTRLELGRRARPVPLPVLEDDDAGDLLAATVRNLSEAVRERARERDRDPLFDSERAVGPDDDADVGRDELVGLRQRGWCQNERADGRRRGR